ncbi:hypothetical protein PS662_05229 [Pseudomonas fluorescens]|uniref:Uncharacterized protein n=1 Tax=Pseudomonas fluorescens TaxID=294 RepID=A0A5E6X939_PSEFL|nr:hypothetical protein [Pseudomonas fluorescens]VVN37097.1 hypothetical protein PS662_05229 [Pseudomonas fluorescens]
MGDQYNQMHERLVKTSEDFTGMIAYSIYKAEKREAIKNGLNIVEFTKLKLQSNEIGKYKREAEGLVNLFLQAAADEKINGVKAELAGQINRLTLDSLPKDPMYKGFFKWHNSGSAGVVGNFWTAVIVAVFVWVFADSSSWNTAKDNAISSVKAPFVNSFGEKNISGSSSATVTP